MVLMGESIISKIMLFCPLKRVFYRTISTCRVCKAASDDFRSDIPDNAPTLNENAEWLQRLAHQKGRSAKPNISQQVSKETYNVCKKGEIDSPGTNPAFICFRSKKSKRTYNVISQPDPKNPYHILSIPVSSYDVSSSPFSTLSADRRPNSGSSQAFSDLKVVRVNSGRGGNGIVAFSRAASVAVGPPDGGDGGDGGDVYVMVSEGLNSLHGIKTKYIAKDGTNGSSGQLDGKKGDSVVITVPLGTNIRWCPDPVQIRSLQKKDHTDEVFHVKCVSEWEGDEIPKYIQMFRNSYLPGKGWLFKDKDEKYHLERDYFKELRDQVMVYDKQSDYDEQQNDRFPIEGYDFDKPTPEPVLILKGGHGGLGNMHFLTSNIRNPRFAKMGRAGLHENFIFELKLLADLGLVGLPNAGKSTLLRAISHARPKVGSWKFTTLQPTIGTIPMGIDQPSFTVADIPGIIKDAKFNRGMGLSFLRHIERSKGVAFVISLGNSDPIGDLNMLKNEVGEQRLRNKNKLVIATKADLPETEIKFTQLRQYCDTQNWKCVPSSPKYSGNIERVIQLMAECSGKYDL